MRIHCFISDIKEKQSWVGFKCVFRRTNAAALATKMCEYTRAGCLAQTESVIASQLTVSKL